MQDAGLLPNVFVSKAAGEPLADKAVNGQGHSDGAACR